MMKVVNKCFKKNNQMVLILKNMRNNKKLKIKIKLKIIKFIHKIHHYLVIIIIQHKF